MNSTWGKNIVYSLFGESHGSLIGITIHHLPAGIVLDLDDIQFLVKILIQLHEMSLINLKL